MAELTCPHCGELHAASAVLCPKTGAAISPGGGELPGASAAEAMPGPTEKGVADILGEAWALYRKHARALLLTCAVLFVPAAVVSSCAVAVITGPTLSAANAVDEAAAEPGSDIDVANRALQDAYQRHADAATISSLQAEHKHAVQETARLGMLKANAAMGSFTIYVLGLFGMLMTAFIFAITVPLTNGALTIAVADRATGGTAEWREVWMLLFRRLWPLLTAIVPAALITAFGFVFLVVPGVILSLLFAFTSPVVLIEGLRGRAALRRSVELVRSDWLRVAIMLGALAVLRWLAQVVANLFIPSSALFVSLMFSNLVTMIFLPVPVLGMVLLYFDIRRKRDGFTDDRLRADLQALKTT